jgi:hypothetical protein
MFDRQMPLEVVNASVAVSAQMTCKSVLSVFPLMSLPVGPVGEVARGVTGIARPTLPIVHAVDVRGEGALGTVRLAAVRLRACELNSRVAGCGWHLSQWSATGISGQQVGSTFGYRADVDFTRRCSVVLSVVFDVRSRTE